VLVSVEHFHPSLTFQDKTGAYSIAATICAPLLVLSPSFANSVRPERNGPKVANALAYCSMFKIAQ